MQRSIGKMVVGAMLAHAAIHSPDAPATICAGTGRTFTFGDLDARANRLANALAAQGFRKGDVVAFLVSNRAEIVELYFALARAGIVGVPLNYRLAAPEMDALIAAMGATGLVYEDRFAPEVARFATPRRLTVRIDGAPGPGEIGYEPLLDAAPATPPAVEIEEDDPQYFNLTSGTTGLPKAYLLTQYNNVTLDPMFRAFDLSGGDVTMTVFPAFGRVGFAWIAAAILHRIPNVLANFEAGAALDLIARHGVTILNLVPTMAAMMLAEQEKRGAGTAELPSLRGIVFAGAILPEPIRAATEARLCGRVYEYYGMQETGALVASTPEDRARAPGSVGRPLLFSELRVVDEAGRDLPPGETGEILGRSPGAASGYFQNAEKTAETFRDGWVHTGDLGALDADGYLFIHGRRKDMIVTGGQNVHAAEVEETLLRAEGVEDCAVFGLPDPLWGESVTALIVGTAAPAALDAHCRAALAGFKVPKRFIMERDPLPRTPTGKVQKFLLVERFSDA
ncbi:MAG: o-succinylbenzoate--CoA ligase [Rhodobacteraceae bacterium]|nr:o-succinylbenzoate--CoA ligase [Paracoccaceae bacterium]MBR25942.1 o-succinylbenzoate--CoA ligase [Paracoccaceae bacterium]